MTDSGVINKIEWKRIELSDRAVFDSTGSNSDSIAMFGFCSLFLWGCHYKTEYALLNGNVVAKGVSDEGRPVIYFPRGLNCRVKETVDAVLAYCEKKPLILPLTKEVAEKIAAEYKNAEVALLEGKCEYVYNRDDLSELAGKKYHPKRNHIAKFDKKYNSEYININQENISELKMCAHHLYHKIENSPEDEFKAIQCAIDNFTELGLRAGVIKCDGQYVAYSIGSVIDDENADIHFEKADREYDGSYAKINNSFAKYGFPDMKYLNREEDLGIEGLRKAKLSYHPCRLNNMYTVRL